MWSRRAFQIFSDRRNLRAKDAELRLMRKLLKNQRLFPLRSSLTDIAPTMPRTAILDFPTSMSAVILNMKGESVIAVTKLPKGRISRRRHLA